MTDQASEGDTRPVHETLASPMPVAPHLGGGVLALVRHQENFARAMMTGDKRAPGPHDIV